VFILLCGQDVGDKVIPVEEPPSPENIQDIKDKGGISFLDPQGGRAVSAKGRRGRRHQLQLLVEKREDRGG
jgi:hypothetical protein